jgi:hypothetical protein
LKRLLEKAEGEVDLLRCRVRALEAQVLSLGGEVPKDEDINAMMSQKEMQAVEEEKEEALPEDTQTLPDILDEDAKDFETPGATP